MWASLPHLGGESGPNPVPGNPELFPNKGDVGGITNEFCPVGVGECDVMAGGDRARVDDKVEKAMLRDGETIKEEIPEQGDQSKQKIV